ncbi:hypothetical protein HOY80DRAFT_415443 [Tuber brumale]|nr:hypothetical protein HOY80DRAFT_415443 [Tuber brumale]
MCVFIDGRVLSYRMRLGGRVLANALWRVAELEWEWEWQSRGLGGLSWFNVCFALDSALLAFVPWGAKWLCYFPLLPLLIPTLHIFPTSFLSFSSFIFITTAASHAPGARGLHGTVWSGLAWSRDSGHVC